MKIRAGVVGLAVLLWAPPVDAQRVGGFSGRVGGLGRGGFHSTARMGSGVTRSSAVIGRSASPHIFVRQGSVPRGLSPQRVPLAPRMAERRTRFDAFTGRAFTSRVVVAPGSAQRSLGTSGSVRQRFASRPQIATAASAQPRYIGRIVPEHVFLEQNVFPNHFRFGLGFDSFHFQVLHGRFFPHPFLDHRQFLHHPFIDHRLFLHHHLFGHDFFVSPFFFPFFPVVSSSVLFVPQVVLIQVPLAVPFDAREEVVTAPGVPLTEHVVETGPAEERGRLPEPFAAAEPPAMPRLMLLVFKDQSIYAVTDYWLEAGRLYYRTSYGGENSVPFEQLDLELTVQMNWERGVEFVLRPRPSTR